MASRLDGFDFVFLLCAADTDYLIPEPASERYPLLSEVVSECHQNNGVQHMAGALST
jgi:hypothetical protein